MIDLLRQRSFAALWSAGLISALGDWLLAIALPFYVYQHTGSAFAAGLMFMMQTVPALLLGSVAGVFADRWNKRRTMIWADISRAAIVLPLLAVPGSHMVWFVYPIAFAEASVSRFFGPAKNALLPQLVTRERLTTANSLISIGETLPMVVGPSVGGVLLAALGLPSVVLLDSVTYVASAILTALVLLPPSSARVDPGVDARDAASVAAGRWAKTWSEWIAGLRLVSSDRTLSALFVAQALLAMGEGGVNALFVVFVRSVLHAGPVQFGWLATAQGIGGVLGGLIVGHLTGIIPRRLLPVATTALGAVFVAVVSFPQLEVALALFAVGSLPAIAWVVGARTLLQHVVADNYRGRVFAAYGTTQALFFLCGQGLGASLGNSVGAVTVFDAAGLFCGLAALAMALLLPAQASPTASLGPG